MAEIENDTKGDKKTLPPEKQTERGEQAARFDPINLLNDSSDARNREMRSNTRSLEDNGSLPKLTIEGLSKSAPGAAGSAELARVENRENLVSAPANTPALSPEGQRLVELARTRIPDAGRPNTTRELQQFERDVAQFERRAREQNLSPDQVRDTMGQVTRLLESRGQQGQGVQSERQRIRLAEQIMGKAAEPTSSDQGENNTCNVTTIENRLYTREPAIAAKLVADLALTGSHTTVDGTTIKLHPDNLKPYGDSGDNNRRGDGSRTFAGQIFQMAAVNLPYARAAAEGRPEGKYEFRQGPNGARLLYHGNINNVPREDREAIGTDQPIHAAQLDQMVNINRMLTGRTEPQAFLVHQSEPDSMHGNPFGSPRELEQRILELQRNNQLPAVLSVHGRALPQAEPRPGDPSRRTPAPRGEMQEPNGPEDGPDGHVILVTGITPGRNGEPARVTFDNQWGNSADRGPGRDVSVNELFRATRDPMQMDKVREIESAERSGAISRSIANQAFRQMRTEYEESLKQQPRNLDPEQLKDQAEFRAYLERRLGPLQRR